MAGQELSDYPVSPDDAELRTRLTPLQYEVTQHGGTEYAFTGEYWNTKEPGTYHCVVCGAELFTSEEKFDSGTGWPSFWAPVSEETVTTVTDTSLGMIRIEARCARCGAHLGHLFPDGPAPTGQRYCMNSASLNLTPKGEDADDADN